MLLFTLVRCVFCVFHLVGEFKEGVLNVVESIWWRFAILRAADGRHDGLGRLGSSLRSGQISTWRIREYGRSGAINL